MDVARRRIWGWMLYDWAQQPYATLGLTFVFGPYFAAVASGALVDQGHTLAEADAGAQSLWSSAQTIAGLVIALTAPFLGAFADASGRKMRWILSLSIVSILCIAGTWFLQPDGTGLTLVLLLFWIGFIASESAFNLNNAILPSLGDARRVGRISGGAAAFGYWGGVLALVIVLLLFSEGETGVTLIGREPPFGLDAAAREGTRFTGPFIAIWFAVFLIPYMLWVRETPPPVTPPPLGVVWQTLKTTLRNVARQRSLRNFLIASMLYRDGLAALYAYGGIYATLVLHWQIMQVGIFGVISAIAAAILTWVGGRLDERIGPKPVLIVCCLVLITVSTVIIGISRVDLYGIPLPEGGADIIFYICGAAIGGAGGTLYSASRSLMVRHSDPARPAEAFGLFALSGRATAFLAPLLITIATWATGDNQLGFFPVIILLLSGLVLLGFVNKNGDRAAWSAPSSSPSP
ncbi:MFS transporter [Pseudoroseicyclus tamaricis]|uniref:MFS transporter n=1 Tax=Pseudoroseicyclus tamaricis TaxID=2705421 RepID=A0A6B2JSV4_9RHOB|nr:MFS transporter [Pseudoroseicyclus tamaricis]NDU99648.1 MFS transporter [Pseudoroseicyclus tamaricis]